MWNKLLGRQSDHDETTTAAPGDGTGMDERANDDDDALLSQESEAGQTVMSDGEVDAGAGAGGTAGGKKRLEAMMSPEGPRVNVRVTVQNESVSASNSAAEEDAGPGTAEGGGDDDDGKATPEEAPEGAGEEEDKASATEDDMMDVDGAPPKPSARDAETSTTAGSDGDENNDAAGAPDPPAAGAAASGSSSPDQAPAPPAAGVGMTLRDNSRAPPSSGSSVPPPPAPSAQTPFEASLLLGISATPEKDRSRETADPSTLPSSYTSFLDMLSDEQKRTRHRFIPGVDGFRKLYKSEVKSDLAEARRIKRRVSPAPEEDGEAEDGGGEEEEENAEGESAKRRRVRKADYVPSKSAFLAPTDEERQLARSGQLAALLTSTDLEKGLSSPGLAALTSPGVTTSLTSHNPPRPQESTPAKTRSRLRRWEACPSEIETDLVTFRKTVDRTREELGKARLERERIESCAAAVRGHLRRHLEMHADEAAALNDEVRRVHGRIAGLDGELARRAGGEAAKGRKVEEVLAALSKLPGGGSGGATSAEDWRAMGVGGVGSDAVLASGWALPGDEVVVVPSGLEGTVVSVTGPTPGSKASGDKKGDAMDVDGPDQGAKEEYVPPSAKIGVRLASTSEVKTFRPSELRFKAKPALTASSTGRRWRAMADTAKSNGTAHDVAAMDRLVDAEIAEERKERLKAAAAAAAEAGEDGGEGGKLSPVPGFTGPRTGAAVPDYPERSVAGFGAGLMEAPPEVRDHAAVMPLERLEGEVRRAVYTTKPRDIPTMPPPNLSIQSDREDINSLRGRVLQLRNVLGRQKRLRSQNERSLLAGTARASRFEGTILEMESDLRTLRERLASELVELGIGGTAEAGEA